MGIKPTVGLVSRAGVVPISHTQDTVGPHARTVADAAAVLTAIVQRKPDPRDPATSSNRNLIPTDYTKSLNPNGSRALSSLVKILHPVRTTKRRIKRAVIPRPVRNAKWIAGGVVNPIDRAEYLARRAAIRRVDKAITPKRKPRS